jgi:hypothetical protein
MASRRLFMLFTLVFVISAAGSTRCAAEPIGWMERYALADDREAMLAELIPGTDDHYFYHCLHYQTVGDLERAESILADWLKEKKGQTTPLIQSMTDRQRLLTYGVSPERTIEYLVRRLGVQLQHSPPAAPGERRFPVRLEEDQIEVQRLVADALRRGDTLRPAGLRYLAERFLADETTGLPITLRDLLNRIDGPYVDGLDRLVIQDLKSRRSNERRFGDLAAHSQLTLGELQEVAAAVPEVASSNPLVASVLRRLRPDADSDPSQQPGVRRDYLVRTEAYVQTLPASYNGLKAAAAFRLLEANLRQGRFDRDLLMRYLQLPRVSPIIRPAYLERQRDPRANLSEDYMDLALLPPIQDERDVVRAHLEHFLRDAETPQAFEPFLQSDYLRRVFAETKLLAGIAPAERWYEMLTPPQRQAIRDSVEVRLTAENRERYAGDDPIELLVDVKNVEELVIRLYEINSLAYHRSHTMPIDTDIDLDGLVATTEKRIEYTQPAEVRHREQIDFPEIEGRGVWVVDLVGKGVRARALIRRGELHHVGSASADGMTWTIIDEHRKPVPSAVMIVGGREFTADDEGRVVLPPVADATQRRAILSDGEIAESIEFEHMQERYALTAAMDLDRTLLQSGRKSEILIRPRLMFGNTPVDPGMLTQASVTIVATDSEGVSTTRKIDEVALSQTEELSVPFRVPHRLTKLEATLAGRLDRLSDAQQETLRTSRTWELGGIRETSQTHDAFLTRDGDDYVIEVRGRTGEPVPAATVTVSLETDFRDATVDQTLQADDEGRVRLGELANVRQLVFGVQSEPQHTRDLRLDRATWPSELHTTADRPIRVPVQESLESPADRYRLLEIRAGAVHSVHTDELTIAQGMLTIESLTPGNYRLIDRVSGQGTNVAVVEGPVIDSVAAGRIRHRQLPVARPLGIDSIERGDEEWKVKLSGETGGARVHVYVKRYFGPAAPIDQLALSPLPLRGRGVRLPSCGYVSDLRLGDEYQYVLRRRYAAKYPGVMLPHPGMLLNPWETETTSNEDQLAREGQEPPSSAAARAPESDRAAAKAQQEARQAVSSEHDFLADPGVQLVNLAPDEEGVVTIPVELVKDMPIVQIVVCDPVTVIQRTLAGSLSEAETVDLRLAETLQVDEAFTLERSVSIVGPENPLALDTVGTGQLQVIDTAGDLFRLYQTLVGDSRFAEFEPLVQWHQLDRQAKVAAYTRLASHETHVFLWAHDREFFDEVIRPYLENKKEKQFVDHWLLEQELETYTQLWQYRRLNAGEKTLLAIRSSDARDSVVREFRERVAAEDEDHARHRRLIESALAGQRLNEMESRLAEGLAEAENRQPDWAFFGDQRSDRDMDGAMGGGMGGSISGFAGDRFGSEMSDREAAAAEIRRGRQQNQNGQVREASLGDFAFGRRSGLRRSERFFRNVDATKQWAESHWDRLRTVQQTQPAALIPIDRFWAELAAADPTNPAPSSELLRPVANRHAALMALALCGLPLESVGIELPTEPEGQFVPPHQVAVVTKRLRKLESADEQAGVLVGQRFEALSQVAKRPSQPNREPDEFLTGVPYRGQVVISNPTPEPKVVDVFWQIPAGSMPLSGGRVTDNHTILLKPLAVESVEYEFYFPNAGEFTHYPATVSADGRLLGRGGEKEFHVVGEPSGLDPESWESIARNGTPGQVREFLQEANLRELEWMLIAHRMRDAEVYSVVTDILAEAQLDLAALWAYGFHHQDESAMRAYLNLREDLVRDVGPVLKSPLLEVDPVERSMIEHLEYTPLVRARIHRLGDVDEILNPTFLTHYREFVRMLSYQPTIDGEQELALVGYLLLQNRIEEALARFRSVQRNEVATQLQYDYLAGYLAMHREDFGQAESIAKEYLDHPIPRWRDRFAELASQLRQRSQLHAVEQFVKTDEDEEAIPSDAADLAVWDRERQQQQAADQQPEVNVRVEGNSLRIDHRRAKQVTLQLYGVDLELLFSKSPFVRDGLERMAMVRPLRREVLGFDNATGVSRFDLNEELRRRTLLVEVIAGGSRSTALYYGGEITTYVSESYGQLQCTDENSHRPVSTAYVKVFAKYPDGSVRFYKDGYTDARGRFDYASISSADAQGATRFAILVLDDERGATLHDVAAPTG